MSSWWPSWLGLIASATTVAAPAATGNGCRGDERGLSVLLRSQAMSELAAHVRPAAGEPEGALVLMHGRATSEQDLAPLLDVFDPERRLVGLAPRGPLELPPGGRHWYVIREIGYPDPETLRGPFPTASGRAR